MLIASGEPRPCAWRTSWLPTTLGQRTCVKLHGCASLVQYYQQQQLEASTATSSPQTHASKAEHRNATQRLRDGLHGATAAAGRSSHGENASARATDGLRLESGSAANYSTDRAGTADGADDAAASTGTIAFMVVFVLLGAVALGLLYQCTDSDEHWGAAGSSGRSSSATYHCIAASVRAVALVAGTCHAQISRCCEARRAGRTTSYDHEPIARDVERTPLSADLDTNLVPREYADEDALAGLRGEVSPRSERSEGAGWRCGVGGGRTSTSVPARNMSSAAGDDWD